MVECLPSKYEALSSSPSIAKTKQKKRHVKMECFALARRI
jgi:hypothetical protein